MRSSRFLPFAPIAALAVAACAQTSSAPTVATDVGQSGDPSGFAMAADNHPIPVVVRGNAFGLSHRDLARDVAGNLQGSGWQASNASYRAQRPETAERQADRQGYSVIMVINGGNTTAEALCADPDGATKKAREEASERQPDTVDLFGALCRYNQAVTQVQSHETGIQGPNDPKFRSMIASASNALTSPQYIVPSEQKIFK